MNIWITGKNLMKPHYHLKKVFIVILSLDDISSEDYTHAQKLRDEFEINNIADYHGL